MFSGWEDKVRLGAVTGVGPISAVRMWNDISRATLSVLRSGYMVVTLYLSSGAGNKRSQ